VADEREKKPEGGAEDEAEPGDSSAEGEERPTVSPPFDPIEFARGILHPDSTPPKKGREKDTGPPPEKMPGSALPSSAPPPSPRGSGAPKKLGLSVPPPSPIGSFEGPFSPGALQGPASIAQRPPATDAHTRATPAGGFRPPAPTYTDSEALEEARKQSLDIINRSRRATPSGALSYVNTTIPSNIPPATKPSAGSGAPPSSEDEKRKESLSGLNAVDAEWADLEAATRPPPAGQNPEDFDIPSRREPRGGAGLAALISQAAGMTEPSTPKAPVVHLPEDPSEPPPSGKKTTPPPAPVEDPAFLARAKKKSIREDLPPTEEEMNERVSLGDYTGALAIAEKLVAQGDGNAAVNAVAENCRTVLRQMYITKIGPMDRVPLVMVPRDQLRWLSIDHRAGFVLSLVDGVSSLEMILDVSGMPELDALRILTELAQQRIISFR